MSNVVDKALFDEAMRVGNQSVSQANRYMRINRTAVDGIHQALGFIRQGRIVAARDRLQVTLEAITKLSEPT